MSARRPNPVYAIVAVRTLQASGVALLLHFLFRWPLTGPHALGLVFTPLLCLYFVFVFVAPWSWGLPCLTRLPTDEKIVALTFDDGPSPETTPQILRILEAYGVRATFFVLGTQTEQHPELLRRIVAGGHQIGLHGYRHRALTLAPPRVIVDEISRSRRAALAACPEAGGLELFRPPHGFKSLSLPSAVRRAGCRMVTWSLNSRDYHAQTAEALSQHIARGLKPGAVVLLHDGPDSHVTTEALGSILGLIRQRGYECVLLGGPG